MTAKKRESMIKKIVVGVAITVLGALAVSYFNGAFDSNNSSQIPTITAPGGRPGATKTN